MASRSLHPEVQGLVAAMAARDLPPLWTMSVGQARAAMEERLAALPPATAVIAGTRDLAVPGPAGDLPVRIYIPPGDGPFPVVAYFHGGGFVIGSIATHDGICREVCAAAGALVASVAYRMGPEDPFPAASDDCLAATRWLAARAAGLGGDPARLAVAGDSAGGNLAAVTALRARDSGGPALRAQLLVYPVTNFAGPPTASRLANADPILTDREIEWFAPKYATGDDRLHPYCSPLLAPDLSGLPPALVQVAGIDPLRDEGAEYARALEKAGVPAECVSYEGAVHGMWSFATILPLGRRMLADGARWLADRLAQAF